MNKRRRDLLCAGVVLWASIAVGGYAVSLWEDYGLSVRRLFAMPIGPVLLAGILAGGALFYGILGFLFILWATEEPTNEGKGEEDE